MCLHTNKTQKTFSVCRVTSFALVVCLAINQCTLSATPPCCKTRVLGSVSCDTKVLTSQAKIPTASTLLVCSHKCPKAQATCLGVLKIEVDLCAWVELDGSLSPVKRNKCTGLLLPSCLCALDAMGNSALGFWTGTPYVTLIVSALISLLYLLQPEIK